MKKITREWGKMYGKALEIIKNDEPNVKLLKEAEIIFKENSQANEKVEKKINKDFCIDDFYEEVVYSLNNRNKIVELIFGNGSCLVTDGATICENDLVLTDNGNIDGSYKLLLCELYFDKEYEMHFLFVESGNRENVKCLTIRGNKIFVKNVISANKIISSAHNTTKGEVMRDKKKTARNCGKNKNVKDCK